MIDTAAPKDFEYIAALNVAAYAEFAPKLAPGAWDVMQQNLKNISERAQSAEFMVFRKNGKIVGSVAYCPAGKSDPAIFKADMASILLLAVDPQYRSKGIAKALTAECVARARDDHASSVGLFTNELMISAQHIYRSLGFQLESELPMRHGVRYFRFVLSF